MFSTKKVFILLDIQRNFECCKQQMFSDCNAMQCNGLGEQPWQWKGTKFRKSTWTSQKYKRVIIHKVEQHLEP